MSTTIIDGLRWQVRERGRGQPLLFLHGFMGRGAGWGAHGRVFARHFRVIVVDLPGHGRTQPADPARVEPAQVSVQRTADQLATILHLFGAAPAHVLGYSMGARIALRLAVAHPDVVRRLVLESPSAGIEDADARDARRVADAALADRLERDGIGSFVDAWERQPIFASQAALSTALAGRLRSERLANSPSGLALSLRGAGQGSMEPLHGRLVAVRAPVLVIAGALDPAGLARAKSVAEGLPDARLRIVPDAGHAPHLESPATFRALTLQFLQEDAAA